VRSQSSAESARCRHTRRNQITVRSRNIQQSGGSMPLFTVTSRSNRSTNEKDRLSRAIHAASIVAGYPEADLFQRFLSLGPSDLRVDLYYPGLPKPRSDQMLGLRCWYLQGLTQIGKRALLPPWSKSLAKQASIQTTYWCSFWRPIVRAGLSVAASSHRPLPSLDQ
jgi:hypothetical protein